MRVRVADSEALMGTTYNAVFFSARKPADADTLSAARAGAKEAAVPHTP